MRSGDAHWYRTFVSIGYPVTTRPGNSRAGGRDHRHHGPMPKAGRYAW